MKSKTMSLYDAVELSFLKLEKRLAKEGVRDISCMDYEKYLRTVFWKEIKEWVLDRDRFRCVVCSAEKSRFCDLEVHHRSYDLDVLEGKNSEMLISLCPRCHKLIEFYSDGGKRVCLEEKDRKYSELKRNHAEIESKGLPLRINRYSRKGGELFEIKYIGDRDHLDFYSVESLMFSFILAVFQRHHDELKIPLPFAVSRFYQKSGAKIKNNKTGKDVMEVKIADSHTVIKVSNTCRYPIYEYFSAYVSEQKYWYVIE